MTNISESTTNNASANPGETPTPPRGTLELIAMSLKSKVERQPLLLLLIVPLWIAVAGVETSCTHTLYATDALPSGLQMVSACTYRVSGDVQTWLRSFLGFATAYAQPSDGFWSTAIEQTFLPPLRLISRILTDAPLIR